MANLDDTDDIEWIEMDTAEPCPSSRKKNKHNIEQGDFVDESRSKTTAGPGKKGKHPNNQHHNGLMLKKARKKQPTKGEARAEEIRKRKREQFLKMLFTARTTLTPWIDVQDVKDVHQAIYESIRFEVKDFGESEYGKRIVIRDEDALASVQNLTFARNKLTAWKSRCRNIFRSQIILSHLTSLESILNVLIEEFNFLQANGSVVATNSSMLYSLYSISVINFCNALTSYPTEYKIDITVRNLAELFDCPSWIVNCRHSLSHPSANPPSLGILGEAIAFALDWMDRFFWSKAMCGKINVADADSSNKKKKSKQTVPSPSRSRPISNSNSTLNFGPPKPSVSKDLVHYQTCLLLFTACPNNRPAFKKNIQQYMLYRPNEYIRSFAEILTFGAPLHERLTLDSFTLPSLLLRRSSRIFTVIFNSLPADQMLILLLNQLLDLIGICEQAASDPANPNPENHQRARHSAFCWLWAIVDALTMVTCPDRFDVPADDDADDEEGRQLQRKTCFQKSFDYFGDLVPLKRRHTYTWLRMLYRICKLQLNSNSAQLVRRFYSGLIDHDVMPPTMYSLLLNVITICTTSGGSGRTTDVGANGNSNTAKSVKDLQQALVGPFGGPGLKWNIPIGASLNNSSACGVAMDFTDDQGKYAIQGGSGDTENHHVQQEEPNDVEMITID